VSKRRSFVVGCGGVAGKEGQESATPANKQGGDKKDEKKADRNKYALKMREKKDDDGWWRLPFCARDRALFDAPPSPFVVLTGKPEKEVIPLDEDDIALLKSYVSACSLACTCPVSR
jgi:hypothetical protein